MRINFSDARCLALSLFLAVVLSYVVCPVSFALKNDHLLSSPSFSDPEYLHHMPKEWVVKPVVHPELAVQADLYMTLSYQIHGYLAERIEKFASEQNFTVRIEESSCSTSTRMLMGKQIDIASFCCSPTENDRLPGVKFHTIGIAPVAILINKSNPVDTVSLENLVKILEGEVVNWSQLGGDDLLIQPVARLHCKKRPGRWHPLNSTDELSQNVVLVGAINDNLEFISRTRGGIGYESLPGIENFEGNELKILRIDGIAPSDKEALARGRYPYYRTYTFTTWEGVPPENSTARKVIGFIKTEIDALSSDLGFVPSATLRKYGWRFHDDELTGEPQ